MNYIFITGTSCGIGKAMTELLLRDSNNYVIGFARTKSIEHENYEHVFLDLSNPEEVKEFEFIHLYIQILYYIFDHKIYYPNYLF